MDPNGMGCSIFGQTQISLPLKVLRVAGAVTLRGHAWIVMAHESLQAAEMLGCVP